MCETGPEWGKRYRKEEKKSRKNTFLFSSKNSVISFKEEENSGRQFHTF